MKVTLDKDELDKVNDTIDDDCALRFLRMVNRIEISKLEKSKRVREAIIYFMGVLLTGSLTFNLAFYFDRDLCEIELSKYKVEVEK